MLRVLKFKTALPQFEPNSPQCLKASIWTQRRRALFGFVGAAIVPEGHIRVES